MKKCTGLLAGLTLALVFTVYAAAQVPSLAAMSAGEKFTSAMYGFTISLPIIPTETALTDEATERGATISWKFKEGLVRVSYAEYKDGTSVNTKKEREAFLKGYRGVFEKSDQVKSLTEAPYAVGGYSGMTYSMVYNGNKSQTRVLMRGSKVFTITALALNTVPGSEALISKAVNSFRLAGPVAK